MKMFFETERLILKAPNIEDIGDFYILQSDIEVMKYIGTGARTKEKVIDATEVVKAIIK